MGFQLTRFLQKVTKVTKFLLTLAWCFAVGLVGALLTALAQVLLFLLVCGTAHGQDINAGHTFVNGETVTASSLNSVVGSATIGTSFYTGKTPVTSVNQGDDFLFYSVGLSGYRLITVGNLLYTNTDLVNSLFLTADYARRSNFLAGVDETARSNFLNQASAGTVSNFFQLPSSGALSNMLAGLWGYAPTPSNQTSWGGANIGLLPIWDTTNAAWYRVPMPVRFTSGTIPFNLWTNVAHGLPGTPQTVHWVLKCTVEERAAGRVVGDEIAASSVSAYFTNASFNYSVPAFNVGASSSNVWISPIATNLANFAYYLLVSTNGSTVIMTNAHWAAKCYATYYP